MADNNQANQPAPASRTSGVIDAIAMHLFAGTPLAPGRKEAQERTIMLAARELSPPEHEISAQYARARARASWGVTSGI